MTFHQTNLLSFTSTFFDQLLQHYFTFRKISTSHHNSSSWNNRDESTSWCGDPILLSRPLSSISTESGAEKILHWVGFSPTQFLLNKKSRMKTSSLLFVCSWMHIFDLEENMSTSVENFPTTNSLHFGGFITISSSHESIVHLNPDFHLPLFVGSRYSAIKSSSFSSLSDATSSAYCSAVTTWTDVLEVSL